MAEIRIIKPFTFARGRPEVKQIKRDSGEIDIIEIRIHEFVLRITETEFRYIVQEVANATNR